MSEVLEIGAGENPTPEATITLDIRTDLEHLDYPGVDVANDEWPLADASVDRIVAKHVLEHVPPDRVGHVFREADRVLRPGGTFHVELPHAGTWMAATDLTHTGPGGTTPEVERYFDGGLEEYWPDLDWDVESWAELTYPLFVRPSLRRTKRVDNGEWSMQLVKFPFVTGIVVVEVTKRA